MGNAATHLHKAVEAAALRPGPRPSIGVKADIHQARADMLPYFLSEAQSLQGIWTIAVHQDIGLRQQGFEPAAIRRQRQVEPRAEIGRASCRERVCKDV